MCDSAHPSPAKTCGAPQRQRVIFGGIMPPEFMSWYTSWEEHRIRTAESLTEEYPLEGQWAVESWTVQTFALEVIASVSLIT
jgi:hypothetical protein